MERYKEYKLIGSGTYAKVYKALDLQNDTIVALKIIQINQKEGMPSTALREISILRSISHPNIIEILNIVHKEDILCIVFEFMDYDLLGYIEKNRNSRYLMYQLVSGIHYLHTHYIVHRDLKPHNILVNKNGILKIADFGLARTINIMDFSYSSEVVTLWYRAPELLMGCSDYKYEIDIWSLGCILFEMVAQKPLLPGNSKENQLKLCREINLKKISQQLMDFYNAPKFITFIISGCLEFTPSKRMKIEDVLEIFNEGK